MYLLITLFVISFALSFWIGYRRMLRLQHLNRGRVINSFVIAMAALTVMTIAHWLGFFPQDIAAKFTMVLYSIVAGFFCGFAVKMIVMRREAGEMEYAYRSFWTEAAPNLIAILVLAFGIYRTGIFTGGPYTGIGITSGLSLLGFGLLGLTVRIVPEFRREGILILDQLVPWKKVVVYSWKHENVLQIEYLTSNNKLTDFTTFIPSEDQLVIERLLGRKLKEHEQERKETLAKVDEVS